MGGKLSKDVTFFCSVPSRPRFQLISIQQIQLRFDRVTYSCISPSCWSHSLLRESLVVFECFSKVTSFVSPVCIILIKLKIWLYSVDKEKGKHTQCEREWREKEREGKMMLIFADWVETKYTDRAPPHHIHYILSMGALLEGKACVWRFEFDAD